MSAPRISPKIPDEVVRYLPLDAKTRKLMEARGIRVPTGFTQCQADDVLDRKERAERTSANL